MHAIQGITMGPDGAIYGGSVYGHSVYRIDVASGAITTFVGPKQGAADDVAFAPDGTVVWTNISEGVVYARGSDGQVRAVARDMPGCNGIAFSPSGRLYVTCVLARDGLYELDLSGARPPRTVIEGLGNLNAFQFADEHTVFGPLMAAGKIARIDVDSGEISEVASGFVLPTSVRLERDGRLIAIDYRRGEVVRVDPGSGNKQVIGTFPCHLDNCWIADDGTIYVSAPEYCGVTAINPGTLEQRQLTWADLAGPQLLSVVEVEGREQLLIADIMCPRLMDPETGRTQTIKTDIHLSGSFGVAADDRRYVVSMRGNMLSPPTLQVLDRDSGKLLETVTSVGDPYDVKVVADGVVIADYAAGELMAIADDLARTRTTIAKDLNGPVGVAVQADAFYISECRGGTISRVDRHNGGRRALIGELDRPEGIALGPDGQLFVAEVGRQRLLAVDTQSGDFEVVADQLDIGFAVGSPGSAPLFPTGVATGKRGTVYVSGNLSNVVYRFDPRQ
jgi:sugar lactone lactonase YvrE